MNISIKDIVDLQKDSLRTIGQKIVYLTIKNNGGEDGWTSVSLSELSRATGLTRTGVINMIKKMQGCGLIEVRNERRTPNERNKYRAIDL